MVKQAVQWDLLKVLGYLVLSFCLAALMAPVLYICGKDLAEYTSSNQAAEAIEWFGNKCDRAKFDRYFKRALLFVGLVLIFPLIFLVRRGHTNKEKMNLGFFRVHRLRDAGYGFCIASVQVLIVAYLGVWSGYYAANSGVELVDALISAVITALVVSFIEELIFRGVLQEVLSRSMKTWPAMIWTALIFAFVHFSQPPKGIFVGDEATWYMGFEFLWQAMVVLFSVKNVLASFSCLFAIGLILSYTRWMTQSLWLGIGMHAGWILMYQLFTKAYRTNPDAGEYLMFGQNVKEGLLPLLLMSCVFVAVVYYGQKFYDHKFGQKKP